MTLPLRSFGTLLAPITLLAALAPSPTAGTVVPTGTGGTDPERRLSVAFYADTSCLLTIERSARIGRTLIDATVGEGESRTLIHCDTEDGQRLTLLARGVTLERQTRMTLLSRESIEKGRDGVIAWLTRAGTSFPDESAPRRYLARGDVYLSEPPPVQASGTVPHGEHQEFARVEGELEAQPGGSKAEAAPER